MAGKVQEGKRRNFPVILNEEELKKYERKLYDKLVNVVGLNRELLRAHGIDYRILHHYLNKSKPWTPAKDELICRIINVVKEEYPGLREIIEELKEYLNVIRKFKERNGTSQAGN